MKLEYLNLSLRYKALTASRANFTHPVVLFPGFGTSERAMFFLVITSMTHRRRSF
ncbi:MAG: hypothetical protein U1F16_10090 [Turneriella sp.]